MRRLLVLGLDSVPPEFVFDRYLDRMPNLRTLTHLAEWQRYALAPPARK